MGRFWGLLFCLGCLVVWCCLSPSRSVPLPQLPPDPVLDRLLREDPFPDTMAYRLGLALALNEVDREELLRIVEEHPESLEDISYLDLLVGDEADVERVKALPRLKPVRLYLSRRTDLYLEDLEARQERDDLAALARLAPERARPILRKKGTPLAEALLLPLEPLNPARLARVQRMAAKGNWDLRHQARRALLLTNWPGRQQWLIHCFLRQASPGEFSGEPLQVRHWVLGCLTHPNPEVRQAAARWAAESTDSDPELLRALVPFLTQASGYDTVTEIVGKLERHPLPEATGPLLKLFEASPGASYARCLTDPRAIPALQRAYEKTHDLELAAVLLERGALTPIQLRESLQGRSLDGPSLYRALEQRVLRRAKVSPEFAAACLALQDPALDELAFCWDVPPVHEELLARLHAGGLHATTVLALLRQRAALRGRLGALHGESAGVAAALSGSQELLREPRALAYQLAASRLIGGVLPPDQVRAAADGAPSGVIRAAYAYLTDAAGEAAQREVMRFPGRTHGLDGPALGSRLEREALRETGDDEVLGIDGTGRNPLVIRVRDQKAEVTSGGKTAPLSAAELASLRKLPPLGRFERLPVMPRYPDLGHWQLIHVTPEGGTRQSFGWTDSRYHRYLDFFRQLQDRHFPQNRVTCGP